MADDTVEKDYDKEQKRIKNRLKAGKLYPASDIPKKEEPGQGVTGYGSYIDKSSKAAGIE